MNNGRLLLCVVLTACAPDPDPTHVSIPGSPIKIAQIDHNTYSVSLDGSEFSRPLQTTHELELPALAFDPTLHVPELNEPEWLARLDARPSQLYLVQFIAPPLEAMRAHLRGMGAQTFGYFPNDALIVKMTADVAERVERESYVRWVGSFRPALRVSSDLYDVAIPTRVYVRAVDVAAKPAIVERIHRLGGTVHARLQSAPLVDATLSPSALAELVASDDVEYIDRWSAPEDDMDIAREISGANFVQTVGNFTGQGVRGEVMDGNVLATHTSFAARPLMFHGDRAGDAGHGTATAGIVFGDGTGNTRGKGVLPAAQGFFASYATVDDRYVHTKELLEAPFFAVFQSNSWGSELTLDYTNVSAEMDRILFDHDILVLQSQSNSGTRQSRPEAWAKNVLSVGAFTHNNTLTPDDDRWEGSASIGPAADGRIKPDLSHFYDATLAPSSSGGYANFGGTSGATPITAGHAGLFFQMWSEGVFGKQGTGATVFERRPHATTAKAMLINTAFRYPFAGELADMRRTHQGWGRVDVKRMHDLAKKMFIVNETDVLAPLATTKHKVVVAAGEPELRVTMVYADPPATPAAGRARVNDLTLRVVSPAGIEYYGNNGLLAGNTSAMGGVPDKINTVENVAIANPAPGTWTVEVRADEINQDGHRETPAIDADYALVASGAVAYVKPRLPASGVDAETPEREEEEESKDDGGCSTSRQPTLAVLFLIALVLIRRRRR